MGKTTRGGFAEDPSARGDCFPLPLRRLTLAAEIVVIGHVRLQAARTGRFRVARDQLIVPALDGKIERVLRIHVDQLEIDPAPLRITTLRRKDSVWITRESLSPPGLPPSRLSAEWVGAERGIATSARGSADQRVEFFAPAWARKVTIEVTMPREQWQLFTDFGFTLLDSDGRQIEAAPINYAVARLEAEIPEGPERQLTIVLSPGFADGASNALWNARLAVRMYAAAPVALGDLVEGPVALPPSPFALPSGFHPLWLLTTRLGDRVWHREAGLPEAPGPLMP